MNNTPAPPRNFRVSCPFSRAMLNCTATSLGKRIRCPSCGQEFVTPELVIPNASAATATANQAASMPIRREAAESGTAGRESGFPQIDTTGSPRQPRRTTRKVRQTHQSTGLVIASAIAAITFVLSILHDLAEPGEYGESDPVRISVRAGIMAIAVPILVAIYILPTLIAYNRGHRNTVPIFVVNFFAGH